MLEDKIQNWSVFLFWMLWLKEVEKVDSVDDLKSSHSIQGNTNFQNFWDAGCEDCVCSEQDHPKLPLQEKGQSGGTESSKKKIDSFAEDRWLAWSTTDSGSLASMNPYLVMPTYLQLFFEMTIFSSSVQDGTTFFVNGTIPTWWYPGKFCTNWGKFKTVLELHDLEIHQKISELEIDDDFGGSRSWNAQPKCCASFNKATALLSPFFFGLCWADLQPAGA